MRDTQENHLSLFFFAISNRREKSMSQICVLFLSLCPTLRLQNIFERLHYLAKCHHTTILPTKGFHPKQWLNPAEIMFMFSHFSSSVVMKTMGTTVTLLITIFRRTGIDSSVNEEKYVSNCVCL